MKILLVQNSLYYPAYGGGNKSNRLLLEALVARGHECRVVTRVSETLEAERLRLFLADLESRSVRIELTKLFPALKILPVWMKVFKSSPFM